MNKTELETVLGERIDEQQWSVLQRDDGFSVCRGGFDIQRHADHVALHAQTAYFRGDRIL